jgi:hypothetical protein
LHGVQTVQQVLTKDTYYKESNLLGHYRIAAEAEDHKPPPGLLKIHVIHYLLVMMMTLTWHMKETVNPIERVLMLVLVFRTISHWLLCVVDRGSQVGVHRLEGDQRLT